MFIIAQIAGALCLVAYILSTLTNVRREVVVYRTLSNIFAGTQYILLGGMTGLLVNVVGSVRNLVIFRKNRTLKWWGIALFCLLDLAIGVIFYDGWISTFIVIHAILHTIYISRDNLTAFRFSQVLTMPLLMLYNLLLGAYVGLAENFVQLTFLLIGIKRYDRKQLKKLARNHPFGAKNPRSRAKNAKNTKNIKRSHSPKSSSHKHKNKL
ncbi:YgjV family protein [Candidatus Saccharibacteria bacterium]|nr:YgjV family protein [Candidatus Saccharibacteria bacterium]